MENIFIPSKNRFSNSPLLKYMEINNINANVVIEPQDEYNYKKNYNNLNFIILPKDNGGITYVRNFIKKYTYEIGLTNYWQLDDDITGFYNRIGTKLIRSELNILIKAQEQFIQNNIALGGLEYRQFAWSANKDIVENSFCDSCVWLDNIKLNNINYREYLEGKEDRDFAMQVIKNGFKTGRITTYAFSSPPNGSNAGGLKEIFYDCNKEKICVERMVEIWGDKICIAIEKQNGRKDVKILWNKINDNQISLF